MTTMRTNLRRNQRGAALIETAITIPIMLLVAVGIFEFGRAYQTWQVLTNAAREGARQAVLDRPDGRRGATTRAELHDRRRVAECRRRADILIERNVPFGTNTASRITVNYPFNFMVLGWGRPAGPGGSHRRRSAHDAVVRADAERIAGESNA